MKRNLQDKISSGDLERRKKKVDFKRNSNSSLIKFLSFFMYSAIIIGILVLYFIWLDSDYQGGVAAEASASSGIISKANRSHQLAKSDAVRRASKKLYELLADIDGAYYNPDEMILGSRFFSPHTYSRQPYVANGYIGSRIPNVGSGYAEDNWNVWANAGDELPGALENGWPLRNRRFAGAFISDFYCLEQSLNSTNFPELDKKGYTTVIASIPQWTQLEFSVNNKTWFSPKAVNSKDVANYSQELSMQNGIVKTSLDWLDGLLHVETEVLAHRENHALGIVSMNVTLNSDRLLLNETSLELNFWDILDFETSHRTVLRHKGAYETNGDDTGIYMVVEPKNVPYSNASLFSMCEILHDDKLKFQEFSSQDNRVSQNASVVLTKDMPQIVVHKYVGIVSTEYINGPTLDRAIDVVTSSYGNYEELIRSHKKAWKKFYDNASIEIPSDEVLEMTARSSLFHILANTRAHNVSDKRGLPVPVPGLSSDSYGGMIFWDTDFWIQPSILPFFPDIAKSINNYRNGTHQQARLNAKEYGYPGALYPWTSGRYANCTSTGPCMNYEYHINVDICMASFSIYLNGANGIDDNYLRYTTWPIVRDAAEFFTAFVQYNKTFDRYETHNLTDPDEYANHVDNGAFTNAGIKLLLKWATDIGDHLEEHVNPNWTEICKKIYIPKSDSNITLEYSGMNSSIEIKQADVTLLTYPLGFSANEASFSGAINDLYYYSEHQSSSGPAMTYPVFVASAASILNHGSSSQSYLYKSLFPYLRGPFAQFSEQSDDNFLTNGGTQPAFPFLTANGAFLQSILFGLTGLRYSYEVQRESKKIQRILEFNPIRLPVLPGGIAIRNFKYLDQVLDIIIDDYNGTIVHKSGNQCIRIKVPNRSLIHDRDISLYHGSNNSKAPKIYHSSTHSNSSARYYTLKPDEELIIPLFHMKKNVKGNLVESKPITNLTSGVSGDVAISAVDGNNFTHWQPANKSTPAKLVIDLGPNNSQIINRGMILWGRRPAKNITISILPHTDFVGQITSNLTTIMEEVSGSNESVLHALEDISGPSPLLENDNDRDVKDLLSWKIQDVEHIVDSMSKVTRGKFVPILNNYKVKPSEPYFKEVYTDSIIENLPSNKTEFMVDYENLHHNSTTCPYRGSSGMCADWRKTRFIIVSIEGSYDNDNDEKGATVKEIVLMN